ncbi:MAG TPA: hypothetical protein VI197_13960 [Polyangiaceae bacterium]
MLSLWLMPVDQRKREVELNDQIKAANVYCALTREFGTRRTAEALLETLLLDAELTWQDVRIGEAECMRIQCGLRMLESVPAIRPTTEQVRHLICKLPSIFVAVRLQRLVRRHLDAATLVDALTWGVRNAPTPISRAHCLAGLTDYFAVVPASEPAALEQALQGFERELRRLRDQDEELLGEVKRACRRVQQIRRSHPALPVPAVERFRAYRIEDGAEVRYLIERREDREPSIDIPHLELRDRTLFLEYSVLDPAVLTENAPAIIAGTLLEEYAADTYRKQAELAVCFDLDWQQTRSISLKG